MQRRTTALLAAAAVAAGALALWLLLREDGPVAPAPPPPPRPVDRPAPDDAPTAPTADARVFRSRDEVILLARRPSDGRPLARAAVALLDAGGAVVGRGDTDSRGFWRGPCPAEARTATVAADAGPPLALPLPEPPAPASSGPPIFADRAVLRPGDALRVLAWFREGRSAPASGVLSVDGEPVPLSAVDTIPGSGWRTFQGRVPGDARPGTASVEIGDARLAIPVVPRWGPAAEPEPAPAIGPDAAAVGDASLMPANGGWRVAMTPPADGHAALVFAVANGWFLDHGVSIAEGSEAFVPLWPEEPAAVVEVVAVVATPDGFRVHRAAAERDATAIRFEPVEQPAVPSTRAVRVIAGEHPVPIAVAVSGVGRHGGMPALHYSNAATHLEVPLDSFRDRDAVIRAIAIPPGRAPVEAAARVLAPQPALDAPAWIYEGDEPAGPAPEQVSVAFQLAVRAFIPAGVPTEFPSDPAVPSDLQLFWIPLADPGSGSVRISAGPVVVSEGAFGGPVTGGLLPARHLADGALVAVSDAAGFRGVALLATFPVAPESIRASDTRDLAVSSRLPGAADAGSEFDAVVAVRAAAPWSGPVKVHLPLPRGVLPAEDGWSIRARAPSGARVTVDDGRIGWTLPSLSAGETTLTVRLRAAFRGRWGAPPASATTEDPTGPLARSAGGTLVVR